MGCGCGGASNMNAMTSTQVNEMLAQAKADAQTEMDVLLASAQAAAINAGGTIPAPQPAAE